MIPFRQLSARKVAFGLIGWLAVTNILVVLTHMTAWWPFTVALFLCLVFLPGIALLRAMQLTLKNTAVALVYSFGLSILTLMLSGLAANQIWYMFGMTRPLELTGAISMWDLFSAGLIALAILRNRQPLPIKTRALPSITKSAWWLLGSSLLLPALAVFGAFRLNNGGDASLAMFTLCYATGLIIYAFVRRRHIPDGLLAWFIFILGLSVLLMTSMRGWDIVGHDIEREFRVFTLTNLHGRWDISLDRNPYNACISITILPQMFASILGIAGQLVFKIILQIIFAVCPAVVFLMIRRYATKTGAFIGSLLFICYPTFINDSAMLTRQGVAYLFFALALVVVSNTNQIKKFKLLFLLCSVGVVLSHYSTAYMYVALFAVALVCKLCITWWHMRRSKSLRHFRQHTVSSPLFVLFLFFITFMWYSQITATSGGLVDTFRKSFTSIPQFFSSDNKSADTSGALFFAGGKTQVQLYQSYLTTSQLKTLNAAPFTPTLVSDDLPLTPIGKAAQSIGIHPSFITAWRQDFARLLQLLALVGVLYVTYKLLRGKTGLLGPDFTCLSLAGIILLGLIVLLPILSMNYGILRAFQQGLIFLLVPIVILLTRVFRSVWPRLRAVLAITGIVVLFLLFTGIFAQVLGGVSPSLSMNNVGLYYGLYSSPEADTRAFTWLKNNVSKKNDVRAANFNKAFMHDPTYPFSRGGILPSQVGPTTYVYVDQAQVLLQRVYTYYESSPLIMTFAPDVYDATKNQIYSTSSTRIYR
jgi:uncharacterized membrane protein